MIETIHSTRNAKLLGIKMAPLWDAYNVWRNTCTKLSAWFNDAIKTKDLQLNSYAAGYIFDYKIDNKYWSNKRNHEKVKDNQCTSAELVNYLDSETNVFSECNAKVKSEKRDVLNYVAERYQSYRKRNGKKKIPHPRFQENLAWYFKEQFVSVDAKKKTLKIKTLIGEVETTYGYGLKDNLLKEKMGGNLRVKTREFIAAVKCETKVLYEPEGITGFDINFQKDFWLTFNDSDIISMPDNLYEMIQQQKELNSKINDKRKPVKDRKIKSPERRRLRRLKDKITKQMSKLIHSVCDNLLNDIIERKHLLAIDGMAPQGSWGQDLLISYLQTQCENKGIPFYIVPAAYTSRTCSVCGFENKNNRKKTDEFKCLDCGYETSAHFNAAVNIANAAQSLLDDEVAYGKAPKRITKQKTVTT